MELLTFMCPPADDSRTGDARLCHFPERPESRKACELSLCCWQSVRFQIKVRFLIHVMKKVRKAKKIYFLLLQTNFVSTFIRFGICGYYVCKMISTFMNLLDCWTKIHVTDISGYFFVKKLDIFTKTSPKVILHLAISNSRRDYLTFAFLNSRRRHVLIQRRTSAKSYN